MSRDAAGPLRARNQKLPGSPSKRSGSCLSASPFTSPSPCLQGLCFLIERICFSQHGISELACLPRLSASKDLKALSSPASSQPGDLTGLFSGHPPHFCGLGSKQSCAERHAAAGAKAVEGVGGSSQGPTGGGQSWRCSREGCLGDTPAVVGDRNFAS